MTAAVQQELPTSGPVDGRRERLLRLVRFGLVGVANTGVSYVVFRLALRALEGVPAGPGIAYAICYAAGFVISFALNRSWTFRSGGRASAEAARFVVAQSACLVASATLISIGVSRLHLPMTPWWLCVTGLTMAGNYALQRGWVFRG